LALNPKTEDFQSRRLLTGARHYRARGYSLIPTRGKIAAVPWRIYQSARATGAQLQRWFAPGGGQDGYTGLAIVTGPISQLAVLDFDDPDRYAHFCRQYRQLAATHTVQTLRGYHLYYRVPPGIRLASRRVPGVDLQYQGRYVVAPPSRVEDFTYQTVQGAAPQTLSQNEWTAIGHFLDRQRFDRSATGSNGGSELASCATSQTPAMTGSDLAALYRARAPRDGRNHTLFHLSCLGRDNGLTQAQVTAALAALHTRQPTSGDHKVENARQRTQEATRTIASAFSRRPRSGHHRYREPSQLPNPVREALLQNKLTCAVRVIEGLRLKGIAVGQRFTKKQAVALLKGIVGRDSVYNALNAVLEDGRPLFTHRKSPLATPLMPTAVAESTVPRQNSKCLELTLSKPGIVGKPRCQPVLFTMPGNRELAQKLGVRPSTISDPLTLDDLQGAKSTRTALHARLIQRRPGQYHMAFFAQRLGLSERSVYRYNQEDGNIHSAPVYRDRALYWHNLETLIPPDPGYFPHDGVFLQDGRGRKYPPKRAIARKLLAARQPVTLRIREANLWWYGEAALPLALRVDIPEQQSVPAARGYPPPYEFPILHPKRCPPAAAVPASPPNAIPPPSAGVVPVLDGRQPLADPALEGAARQLKEALDRLSQPQGPSLSLFSARRMLAQYGVDAVERALQVTARRRNLHNPPGFLATLLRSEKRAGRLNAGHRMAR
jgi:hypothetical protein